MLIRIERRKSSGANLMRNFFLWHSGRTDHDATPQLVQGPSLADVEIFIAGNFGSGTRLTGRENTLPFGPARTSVVAVGRWWDLQSWPPTRGEVESQSAPEAATFRTIPLRHSERVSSSEVWHEDVQYFRDDPSWGRPGPRFGCEALGDVSCC